MEYFWLDAEMRLPRPDDLESINALLKRLSPNSPKLAMADIERIARIESMSVVFARDTDDKDRIVGMARLVSVPMLVGREGVVEDVVVDQACGGRGIGTQLMLNLLARARALGLVRVVLTTWPDREAANRLYSTLGFERLGINYYRLEL